MNEYFSEQSNVDDSNATLPPFMPPPSTLDNITISDEDVLDVQKLINTSKASGPDFVHAKLPKEGAQKLTKRSFSTHSFENLSCKSYNVVYAIECALCGLIYVGETKGELRKRMNGRRSSINTGGNQLLYKHFNLPDHSVLSMKVRILEKIYHPTSSPGLSTPFRRKREEHWIRQLGTAAPYGCNDHIDSIGNLTSPGCQSVNVLNLFDRTSRRHRSHGSRKYNKPEIHDVSFDGLLPFVNLQLGLHHIRTRLYSLPLNMLHD